MVQMLKFQFDDNQDYQLEAIQAVVDVFNGLSYQEPAKLLSGEFVRNMPEATELRESFLESNVKTVQARHKTEDPFKMFELDSGLGLEGLGDEVVRVPHFTIEMETGTGKTYTYLRTMYELHKHYGFMKFIVIVPSIAIYEGVRKAFEVTRSHFTRLYDGVQLDTQAYDSDQLGRLNGYATIARPECLIMTLDSFNKSKNVIFRPSEKLPGQLRPYQYIQQTRPIIILDEPQNMESETSKSAIRTLHPLFVLRYSATHKSSPNLLYRLTPFEAFQRGLVKTIEVDAVQERDDFNQAYIGLRAVRHLPSLEADLLVNVLQRGISGEQIVTLKKGDDLQRKTGREEHQGYVVEEINASSGTVAFANGYRLNLTDQEDAPRRKEIFRTQIRETILAHFAKQSSLYDKGIKVLSLFFVDKVSSYTSSDGLIRHLFDEEFERLKKSFPYFNRYKAEEVRQAYFAQKKDKNGVLEAIDTGSKNKEERAAEKATFELIMRNKERLLSFDEPAAFIFAHSALKEGWDNPNVFQICTLQNTQAESERRQRVGRGLRLCVDQTGQRIQDSSINQLTVIANESYADYVRGLQQEYRAEGNTDGAIPPTPTPARRKAAKRNNFHFESDEFKRFWEKLSQRTRYHIHVDTQALIELCLERLNNATYPNPLLVVEKGRYVQMRASIKVTEIIGESAQLFVQLESSDGESSEYKFYCRKKDSLAKKTGKEHLQNYTVLEVKPNQVVFENEVSVHLDSTYTFDITVIGQAPQDWKLLPPDEEYPIFNLVDRTVKTTGLTRPTINKIFNGLIESVKSNIFKNPEGFANIFIDIIRNTVAEHIADRLEFEVVGGAQKLDLNDLFPPTDNHPQRELIPSGERGLYDQVQKDSEVEVRFVERLKDDDAVIFYFKFPPKFKVDLPRIIGNYNPDWGIVRQDADGKTTLQLVRETKGTDNLARLQFAQEGRKIKSAERHFAAIGIDYRHIAPNTPNWWEHNPQTQRLKGME